MNPEALLRILLMIVLGTLAYLAIINVNVVFKPVWLQYTVRCAFLLIGIWTFTFLLQEETHELQKGGWYIYTLLLGHIAMIILLLVAFFRHNLQIYLI